MILLETTGDPMPVSINGMPPQSMRQRLVTFKLRNDKDVAQFHEEMAKGRDMVSQVQLSDCTYVMIREFIPSKIALPSPNMNAIEP